MHRMPLLALIFMSLSFTLYGEETAADKLAAESEAYCNETAKDAAKLTPQMVIEKVDTATALVAKDGPAAFAKFKGKGCEYLFAGTYIWIHDMDGVMQMHPIKNKAHVGLEVKVAWASRPWTCFFHGRDARATMISPPNQHEPKTKWKAKICST